MCAINVLKLLVLGWGLEVGLSSLSLLIRMAVSF